MPHVAARGTSGALKPEVSPSTSSEPWWSRESENKAQPCEEGEEGGEEQDSHRCVRLHEKRISVHAALLPCVNT